MKLNVKSFPFCDMSKNPYFFGHEQVYWNCQNKEVKPMLVLGRNLGDTIVINDNITIKFFKGKGADFKVAIDAPKEVKIMRGEVDARMKEREEKFAYLEQ